MDPAIDFVYEPSPTDPLLGLRRRRKKVQKCIVTCLVVIFVILTAAILWWIFIPGKPTDVHFNLVSRANWEARILPQNETTPLSVQPPEYAIIIHTVTDECFSFKECCYQVRDIQSLHMDRFHFNDIGYNFLVGSDGRTYEGRGWGVKGAFAIGYNSKALGIAVIGDFEYKSPSEVAIQETKELLRVSVERNHLAQNYTLLGHRQISETISPGQVLYDIIKSWPHWKDCYMQTCSEQ